MQVPTGWSVPARGKYFDPDGNVKLAEKLFLCSPFGRHLLALCINDEHVDKDILRLHIEMLEVLEGIQHKCPEVVLEDLEVKLNRVLADYESRMPLFWCTMVKHVTLHSFEAIRLVGAFWSQNMLVSE